MPKHEENNEEARARAHVHARALLRRAIRFDRIDEIRKTYTKRGKFERGFLRLDDEEAGGPARLAGDGGRGACAIRAFDEPEPAWRRAFDAAFARLDATERTVAEALLEDPCPARAARRAHVSRMTVYRVLHALRARFAEAYRLYGSARA